MLYLVYRTVNLRYVTIDMHTNNDIIISHVMGKARSLLVPRQLQLMGSHEQIYWKKSENHVDIGWLIAKEKMTSNI